MTGAGYQSIDLRQLEGRVRASRALAFVRLVRPLNMLIVAIGVFVGGFLAEGASAFDRDMFGSLVLASLSVVGVAAAANSLNDVADLEIDRVNRPDRPLASGLVSTAEARAIWILGSLLGILAAALLSVAHLVLAVGAVGLMYLYNRRLKRVPLAGNLTVGILVATAIVFGAMAIGAAGAAANAAVFAFLVTLAREIIKDVEDIPGDLLAGARTTAVSLGETQSRYMAAAIILLTIALTPLPFVVSGYSGLYLSLVLLAAFVLAGSLADVAAGGDERIRRASARLKWAMLLGLSALAFAHALD